MPAATEGAPSFGKARKVNLLQAMEGPCRGQLRKTDEGDPVDSRNTTEPWNTR